jgi:hypothetical protein
VLVTLVEDTDDAAAKYGDRGFRTASASSDREAGTVADDLQG